MIFGHEASGAAARDGADLPTPAEMAAIEAAAIGAGAVGGAELMQRAGAGCLAAVRAARPDLAAAPGRARVLCGPGNNGGDGYVIARGLAERGWAVAVREWGDPARLPPDAAGARAAWLAAAGTDAAGTDAAPAPVDLLVDALFGGGLARPLAAELAEAAAGPAGMVLAVDLPSGLCGATGRDLGVVRPADLTVTFHRERPGHHLGVGPEVCGRLAVVDLGLEAFHRPTRLRRLGAPDPVALGKARAGHKYRHGHALVLGGGPGRGGAARLAARAALRVGAGLATVGTPPAALQENAARLDAVMLRPVRDAAALAGVLADARVSAVLIGPGHGLDDRTRAMTAAALASGRPVVADADALSAFAGRPEALRGAAVLTPHAGEFRRLFPDAPDPETDPVAAAEAACALLPGTVIVLKGPATLVAGPDGLGLRSGRPEDAAPWLASAGTGDVLAGLIAGLLARGFSPQAAAETAVWLHAEAARAVGPGLIAEDLPEALPGVLRALGAA